MMTPKTQRLLSTGLWVLIGILLVIMTTQAARSAEITYDSGLQIYVPEAGWHIAVRPKGFNNLPYSVDGNINGQLPGFGGWPLWNDYICPDGDDGRAFCESPRFLGGPTIVEPEVPVRCDFYDSGCDGVVEWGRFAGCTYNIFQEGTEFDCGDAGTGVEPPPTEGPNCDFYDSGCDGVIDFGGQKGCTYDPFGSLNGRRYECPVLQ